MFHTLGAITINTPEDAYYVSLAYETIKAKLEMDKHFSPKMTEDRAYQLGLILTGSETQAYKYVMALNNGKADKYGSRS
jgi:hypothetical protein